MPIYEYICRGCGQSSKNWYAATSNHPVPPAVSSR